MTPVKVLFVCLGNICRSPMAEGLFSDLVQKSRLADQFLIDSAGTSSYHQGELPDRRMRATAQAHGIALTTRARPFRKQDLHDFDYIAAMDRPVYRAILDLAGKAPRFPAKVFLMRDHDPAANSPSGSHSDSLDVPDPYYGGQDGFEEVYTILDRSTRALLHHILEARQGKGTIAD